MMTNKEILRIAIEQSAVDANCQPEDFMKTEPVIVTSRKNPDARRYLMETILWHPLIEDRRKLSGIIFRNIRWSTVLRHRICMC